MVAFSETLSLSDDYRVRPLDNLQSVLERRLKASSGRLQRAGEAGDRWLVIGLLPDAYWAGNGSIPAAVRRRRAIGCGAIGRAARALS